jgi:hypothetical protein
MLYALSMGGVNILKHLMLRSNARVISSITSFPKNEVADVSLSTKIDYDIFSLASGRGQIRGSNENFG